MRYVFGPSQSRAVRGDLPVAIKGIDSVDGVETVTVTIPPHDATHANPLLVVFAFYLPAQPQPGDMPEAIVNAGHPGGSMQMPPPWAVAGGHDLVIRVPDARPGASYVQVILGYDDSPAAAPAPQTENPAVAPSPAETITPTAASASASAS